MKASPLLFSLCAVLFALSGCASPCESVCARFNVCTVKERDQEVDCPTFCSREQQFEQTAAKADADTCKKEFDAHLSCWQKNIGEICNAESTVCEASAKAWVKCMEEFCENHATDQACVPKGPPPDGGPPPDAGAPAWSGF